MSKLLPLGMGLYVVLCAVSSCCVAAESPLEKPENTDVCDVSEYVPGAVEKMLLAKPIVLLGEVRGTVEAPQVAAEIICRAAITGKRLLLAIEAPDNVSPYVLDADHPSNSDALLVQRSQDFWLRHADASARTEALKHMLTWVIGLSKRADKSITVRHIGLPANISGGGHVAPGWYMANHLQDIFHSKQYDQIIVLTAHHQARVRVNGLERKGDSIAAYLPVGQYASIGLYPRSGSYLNCGQQGCIIRTLSTQPDDIKPAPTLLRTIPTRHGWHGVIQMAKSSPSPPVERLDGD